MIAAFRNFYVSEMRGRKPEVRRVVIGNVSGPPVRKGQTDITVAGVNAQRRTSNAQRRTIRIER